MLKSRTRHSGLLSSPDFVSKWGTDIALPCLIYGDQKSHQADKGHIFLPQGSHINMRSIESHYRSLPCCDICFPFGFFKQLICYNFSHLFKYLNQTQNTSFFRKLFLFINNKKACWPVFSYGNLVQTS